MAGTDFPHHCSEWPGNQAVFIRISILAVRLLNAQVGIFFYHFVTAVYFLSSCLSVQHDAQGFSCERGKNSLVFTRGFVGSANALNGCTPGRRRGRLESLQLEVVVPLPKKQNKTKIWKLIPHPCAKREEKQPLSSIKG